MENNDKPGISFLMTLLEKIDSWKKVGIFVVLFFFSGVGCFLYTYQKEVFFFVLNALEIPQIDSESFDGEAASLIRETHAISVAVWTIELVSNRRVAIYINVNGARNSNLEGTGDLILRKKARLTEVVIELLENDTACSDVIDDSPVAKTQITAGVTYTCLVSVPPRHDSIVGVISLGFATRPVNEDYIRRRLLQAAENITR